MMKPIEGYGGSYFVDKNGNVYSSAGKFKQPHRRLSPRKSKKGLYVSLYRDGGRVNKAIHHIVLEAFVGPRPTGMNGCHGPNGFADNSVGNVYWATQKQNMADRVRDGTDNRGEKQWRAKLNRMQVRIILRLRGYMPQHEIAAFFGVGRRAIGKIYNKKNWVWFT